uniref:alpha/beta fold hydrolase n=1 Tax=Candidatus Fimivicinus sp. TaxID=3056640 RepID=UPI003FEF4377
MMELQVNGIPIYYEKGGRGCPVMLLHGNGGSHRTFDGLMEKLAGAYTVYAPDSRGHGKSGKAGPLSYEQLASDTAALIQALGLEKPMLYGFSDGGIVGLLVASGWPGLLSKLAVSGANSSPAGLKPRNRFTYRLLYTVTKNERIGMMLHGPALTQAELNRIEVPTLVMAGERDVIREEDTRFIASQIPNAELKILPGESHGSYVHDPDKLASLLIPFFGKRYHK